MSTRDTVPGSGSVDRVRQRLATLTPTGRRVDIRGVDVMEIADGLIQHNTIYYDGATFARQIGLLPGLGSRADQALLAAFNAKTTLSQRARDRRQRRRSRTR